MKGGVPMIGKLLGFKRFKSKQGKEYCVANLSFPYSQRDVSNGCVGERVEECFLPDDYINVLNPSDVGLDINVEKEIVGNRAYVVAFDVLRPMKK